MIWAAALLADVTVSFTGLTAMVPGRDGGYHAVLVNARKPRVEEIYSAEIPAHVPFVMAPADLPFTLGKGIEKVDCVDPESNCFVLSRTGTYTLDTGGTGRVKVDRSFRNNVASMGRLRPSSGPIKAKHLRGKGVAATVRFDEGTLSAPEYSHCSISLPDETESDAPVAEWVDLQVPSTSRVTFCRDEPCTPANVALEFRFDASDQVRLWVKNLPLATGSRKPSGHGGHIDSGHFALFYTLLDQGVDRDDALRPPVPTCSTHGSPPVPLDPAEDTKAVERMHFGLAAGLKNGPKSIDDTICPPLHLP
jgi:hypothetical protein